MVLTVWFPIGTALMQVSRCPEVDPHWTHNYVPFTAPSGNFGMPKTLPSLPKWIPMQEKQNQVHIMANDALTNFQCLYNIFLCSYDHFRTLGECKGEHPFKRMRSICIIYAYLESNQSWFNLVK